MKNVFICSIFNLRQWKNDSKTICVFLLAFGYLFMRIDPVNNFIKYAGVNCSPWIFPFITSDKQSVLFLMVCFILLICDVPSLSTYQTNIVVRIGKTSWILGQISYIIVAAFIYWTSIFIFSIIASFPNVNFTLSWGKILLTLAQTDAGSRFNILLPISYKIINTFSPVEATLLSLLTSCLVSVLLALIVILFNMSYSKYFGILIACLLTLMQYFAYDSNGYFVYNISPVSWISLNILNVSNANTHMPTLSYAIICLTILNIVLCVVILFNMNKKSVDLMK